MEPMLPVQREPRITRNICDFDFNVSIAFRIQFHAVGFKNDVFDAAFFTDVPDADPFQRHVLDGQSRIAK